MACPCARGIAFVKKEAPEALRQRGLSKGYLVRLTTSSNERLLVEALAIWLRPVFELFFDLSVSPFPASSYETTEIGKVQANFAEPAALLHHTF